MIELDFDVLPSQSRAKIKVLGVGGAGGNTVNYMIDGTLLGEVSFIAANTDAQALSTSYASDKIQLGTKTTKGLGSGANPEVGKKAAEEDLAKVLEVVEQSDIVFLTGGLGGGTGSGALPVIARALKDRNILTVAVVTKPFEFEGKRRMLIAEKALEALKNEVDTLVVVPNQKLLEYSDKSLSLMNAFGLVNEVIYQFVTSIAQIILRPGYINVDFADVRAIMHNMGIAVMGTGKASGKDRAELAALDAISSPLLENVSIEGARSILLNITAGLNLGLHEVQMAASIIQSQAHRDASIILGSVIDETLGDEMQVTVIATGFVSDASATQSIPSAPAIHHVAQPVAAPTISPVPVVQAPAHAVYQSQPAVSEVSQEDLEVPTLLRKMVREKQAQLKN